jgi:hypothetical protein
MHHEAEAALSLRALVGQGLVVENGEGVVALPADSGSFDCVRLAPRFAQDDDSGQIRERAYEYITLRSPFTILPTL